MQFLGVHSNGTSVKSCESYFQHIHSCIMLSTQKNQELGLQTEHPKLVCIVYFVCTLFPVCEMRISEGG